MKNDNLTKRQLQAINTKKKIYDVAMELMNTRGFDNTTIEDISKKANVSVGAFYHYYKSKDDIFFELYKIADEYFKSEVSLKLVNKTSSEQIIIYFEHYAKYNQDRGLDAIRQLYNSKNKNFIAQGRYMKILLEEIISDGFNKKELKSTMTTEETADYFLIFARGIIYDWCLHDAEYNLQEKMIHHMSLVNSLFTS